MDMVPRVAQCLKKSGSCLPRSLDELRLLYIWTEHVLLCSLKCSLRKLPFDNSVYSLGVTILRSYKEKGRRPSLFFLDVPFNCDIPKNSTSFANTNTYKCQI